jgi:hypothetical protein
MGEFVVTSPDVEPMTFKSRREAKDWCAQHHPVSPIKESGADAAKRAAKVRRATSGRSAGRGCVLTPSRTLPSIMSGALLSVAARRVGR